MTRTAWLIAAIGTAALAWLEVRPLMLGVKPVLVFVLAGALSSMQPRFAVVWGILAGGTIACAELARCAAGASASVPFAVTLTAIAAIGIGACGAGAGRSLSAAFEVREGSRPK